MSARILSNTPLNGASRITLSSKPHRRTNEWVVQTSLISCMIKLAQNKFEFVHCVLHKLSSKPYQCVSRAFNVFSTGHQHQHANELFLSPLKEGI